jgi:hypothetical protein
MPHSTVPLVLGWRQLDLIRVSGERSTNKATEERAGVSAGVPASGGVELYAAFQNIKDLYKDSPA